MASRKAGIIAGLAVAGLAAAGLVTSTVASADTTAAPSSNPTASAQPDGACDPGGRGGASQDTPVTGDEAQRVIEAVKAKDAGVTVETVRKDPDGTYDALGTRADGTRVMYDVSTDLATITGNAGRGGPRGGEHTPDAER